MVTRAHGPRQKTRHFMKKRVKERGRILITRHLQEFNEGERVLIKPDSSVQKGIPSRRFFGKTGIVSGKRGKSYLLLVEDGKMIKQVIIPPIHLRRT